MYLVEIKLGDYVIQKYINDYEALQELIRQNPQYEYIKIIEKVDTKTRRRKWVVLEIIGEKKIKKK